MFVRHIIPRTP